MKLQTAIAISLIVFAVCASAYLFIRPIFVKPPQIVTDRNLEYVGKSLEGESAYKLVKAEITFWITQLAKIIPLVSTLFAMWIMHKKFKREIAECKKNGGG